MHSNPGKINRLKAWLAEQPGVVVAYSGGVDSTMLLHAAVTVLGTDRVLAITADSPTYASVETLAATSQAREMGLQLLVVKTNELNLAEFRANPPERCYFCKREIFTQLRRIAGEQGRYEWPLLHGATADDKSDFRPGSRAAHELGARAPLAEIGFTKDEIRQYSREHKLPTAEKPSFACLASRIPYGTPIDAELLERIGAAETYLREKGYKQFRVRHHGELARIEVEADDLPRILTDRQGLIGHLKKLGYTYVTLDLQGFRSGALNEVL